MVQREVFVITPEPQAVTARRPHAAVLHVVLTCVYELHRPSRTRRNPRRFDGEAAFQLPAEGAAEQRRVDGHTISSHAECRGDFVSRGTRHLDRRPELAALTGSIAASCAIGIS